MNDVQLKIKLLKAKETVCTGCCYKNVYACAIWVPPEFHKISQLFLTHPRIKEKYQKIMTTGECIDYIKK